MLLPQCVVHSDAVGRVPKPMASKEDYWTNATAPNAHEYIRPSG